MSYKYITKSHEIEVEIPDTGILYRRRDDINTSRCPILYIIGIPEKSEKTISLSKIKNYRQIGMISINESGRNNKTKGLPSVYYNYKKRQNYYNGLNNMTWGSIFSNKDSTVSDIKFYEIFDTNHSLYRIHRFPPNTNTYTDITNFIEKLLNVHPNYPAMTDMTDMTDDPPPYYSPPPSYVKEDPWRFPYETKNEKNQVLVVYPKTRTRYIPHYTTKQYIRLSTIIDNLHSNNIYPMHIIY